MSEYRDRMRQLLDLAVSAGRSLQSPQTGFVHLCYEPKDSQVRDTIPIYENFLFVLALFRLRFPVLSMEAKKLFESLIEFQEPEKGRFPLYLHQYPRSFDDCLGHKLLLPLYWILLRFHTVLGSDLAEKGNRSARLLLADAESVQKERELPFAFRLQKASAFVAFGRLWKEEARIQQGEKELSSLREESLQPDFGTWYVPELAASAFVALQMVYPNLKESPWSHLWDHLSRFYHRVSLTYAGPGIREEQWGRIPKPSLYDYLMAYLGDHFAYRVLQDRPEQLFGALVQPHDEMLPEVASGTILEGSLSDHRWSLCHANGYALSVMQKRTVPDPQIDRGFYPLRLVWGNQMRGRSFVCQGGGASLIDYVPTLEGVDLLFTLDQPVDTSHKESGREIAFYLDRDESDEFYVGKTRSNTFRLQEPVSLVTLGLQIGMEFFLEEGDAHFQGHIMPANRPAQRSLKGEHRFEAYDWLVTLRTVRRYTDAVVRVRFAFRAL